MMQNAKPCIWRYEEEGYQTECGHNFYFTDDDIPDNSVKYCMFCGRKIEVEDEQQEGE